MRNRHFASALALAVSLSACGGSGSGSSGDSSAGEGRVVTPAAAIKPIPIAPDAQPTGEPIKPSPTPTSTPAAPPLPDKGTVATPDTLAGILAAARGGDTIVLSAGDYGLVTLPRTKFTPAITINGSRATVSEILIYQAGGIEWSGGKLSGDRDQSWGVRVDTAERVRISGMSMSGPKIGIGIIRSTDVEASDNRFDGIRSDGVNIAMSQRVKVLDNVCVNFSPVLPVYDAVGKLVTDGDHPDCVQGWSRAGYAPTSDVLISGNTAVGLMQGVWFEDNGDGGYDRVTVRDNDLTLAAFQGINILGGRGTTITGNRVRAVPGSRLLAFPFPLIRPWIMATGTNIKLCGNLAESYPADDPANVPC